MKKEIIKGNWNELKGKVKETFGKLTDDDLTQIKGKREQFLGALQKRYGYAKDEADKRLKEFEKKHKEVEETEMDETTEEM